MITGKQAAPRTRAQHTGSTQGIDTDWEERGQDSRQWDGALQLDRTGATEEQGWEWGKIHKGNVVK